MSAAILRIAVQAISIPLARAENEVVNLADLPLDAVDRVEVYRGTTPLAFAQAGAGGIVNIVTRRPGSRLALQQGVAERCQVFGDVGEFLRRRRVALPSYAFERERCWLEEDEIHGFAERREGQAWT